MEQKVNAIQAEKLGKRYGKTEALSGVDLEVPEGSVFGLIGPNGVSLLILTSFTLREVE